MWAADFALSAFQAVSVGFFVKFFERLGGMLLTFITLLVLCMT